MEFKTESQEAVIAMTSTIENICRNSVENSCTGNWHKVRYLKSDNEIVFFVTKLQSWLERQYIIHEVTNRHSLESNHCNVRLSRSLLDIARAIAILAINDFQPSMCAEAVNTIWNLRNRLCSKSTAMLQTRNELLRGAKSIVSHLQVFCCKVFVHVPKQVRASNVLYSRQRG